MCNMRAWFFGQGGFGVFGKCPQGGVRQPEAAWDPRPSGIEESKAVGVSLKI